MSTSVKHKPARARSFGLKINICTPDHAGRLRTVGVVSKATGCVPLILITEDQLIDGGTRIAAGFTGETFRWMGDISEGLMN